MKRLIYILFIFFFCLDSFAQITNYNDRWTTGNSEECGRLKSVEIQDNGVIVTIEVKALKALNRLRIFSTYNTYITSGNY